MHRHNIGYAGGEIRIRKLSEMRSSFGDNNRISVILQEEFERHFYVRSIDDESFFTLNIRYIEKISTHIFNAHLATFGRKGLLPVTDRKLFATNRVHNDSFKKVYNNIIINFFQKVKWFKIISVTVNKKINIMIC